MIRRMPEGQDADAGTRDYVVKSRFFVVVVFLLSFLLFLIGLLSLWINIGLNVIFGVESPAGGGVASYVSTLVYLLFAMVVSVVIGLLCTIYFKKIVAYVYSIALGRNARDYKLKEKWFRRIAVACGVAVLLTHVVAGGSILLYFDSLISTNHPRNYRRTLLVMLGGLWLLVSFLVEASIITVLGKMGIDPVEEVESEGE